MGTPPWWQPVPSALRIQSTVALVSRRVCGERRKESHSCRANRAIYGLLRRTKRAMSSSRGGFRWTNPAARYSVVGRLPPTTQMQLAKDVLEMVLDRVFADHQARGDFSIRQSVGDQLEHLELACSEILRRLVGHVGRRWLATSLELLEDAGRHAIDRSRSRLLLEEESVGCANRCQAQTRDPSGDARGQRPSKGVDGLSHEARVTPRQPEPRERRAKPPRLHQAHVSRYLAARWPNIAFVR
jgi:hypothetical protein